MCKKNCISIILALTFTFTAIFVNAHHVDSDRADDEFWVCDFDSDYQLDEAEYACTESYTTFSEADVNRDGRLSFPEFLGAYDPINKQCNQWGWGPDQCD